MVIVWADGEGIRLKFKCPGSFNHRAGIQHQALPCFGDGWDTGGSIKEIHSDLNFQLGDGSREGGLGPVEPACSSRKRPRLADGDERFQAIQGDVHMRLFYRQNR